MSIKIEIKDTDVQKREFTYKQGPKAGTKGAMYFQTGYAHTTKPDGTAHPYPQTVQIPLEEGQNAYPTGFHTVAPASFFVGKFDELQMRLRLVPLGAPKAAA